MSSVISSKEKKEISTEIDLGRLIGELIDHRKLICAVTALFTLVALLYVICATPIYQANALIQVEQKQGNAILSNLSQMLPNSQPPTAPEVALLQSRMILGKTVNDLNLQADVKEKHFPLIGRALSRVFGETPSKISINRIYMPPIDDGNPEMLLTVTGPGTYSISGDGFSLDGKVGVLLSSKYATLMVENIDAEVGTQFNIKYLTNLEAIQNLQKVFSVFDQGKDTGILNLTLNGSDPDFIVSVLNNIAGNYLAQNISREAAQDAKSLEFLNSQLPKVREELDIAEDKLNNYRRQQDSVDLSLEAKSALDQIVNVDNQLNELTFRESEISQLFTREHPTYKALIEKKETLKQEKERLNQRVAKMPGTQQVVLRLSRDVESGRAIYMQLLNRQQELNISKSSAIGNVRIIDDAVADTKPVKPKKILIVLIGIVFGGCVSVGLVLLRVFLRRGIESPEAIEDIGLNVYASIPVSEWLSKKIEQGRRRNKNDNGGFLALENPADLAIEAIRSLRTSLHFAMLEAQNNVLMFSGASPGVGKTFVSSNLAAVISQTGKKVLFVDADMRRGYTHKMFNYQPENGLSDILSGKIEFANATKSVATAGFDFISRGQIPPNPAELLMHPRFKDFIEWASKNYELVIIDTPPILAVTDAAIIGRYSGTNLLVARCEVNTAKELEVSLKRFEQNGVTIRGCILNGIVKKASSYYSYGYTCHDYSYTDKNK